MPTPHETVRYLAAFFYLACGALCLGEAYRHTEFTDYGLAVIVVGIAALFGERAYRHARLAMAAGREG